MKDDRYKRIPGDLTLTSPLLIVLQETNGKFGPIVEKNMYRANNIAVFASKSGKLSSELVIKWYKNVFLPTTEENSVLLLDSWSGQTKKTFDNLDRGNKNVDICMIPAGTTERRSEVEKGNGQDAVQIESEVEGERDDNGERVSYEPNRNGNSNERSRKKLRTSLPKISIRLPSNILSPTGLTDDRYLERYLESIKELPSHETFDHVSSKGAKIKCIHIYSGYFITVQSWDLITVQKHHSKFVKYLAESLWRDYVLANSNVGEGTNRRPFTS
ncbi:uncharacterized protein LOC127280279 [Leptopilina boulardi]|uniref:uncharacterized protein LOC127280279 n=1 Tax=Leptopilina boulardi TaxID=63433 RepID=UPI0021F60B2D|nr:uncharacterized protein LOC127280279 [Leptopilina boulardi]